ncbi:MAG: [LysW]-lysine hydrolase [Anaerolineae bacterium]
MNPDVELLHRMVSIPSVSGSEQELAGFLVRAMRERGFTAAVDEAGNAIGELGDGPQEILLLGHMDTVPGAIPVQIHAGALYGRGAVDAKGPLAAFIAAVTRVGPLPGKRLVVAGAVEEEAASSKGARHLLQTRRPAVVVIGEPSGWERITIAYKGRLLVEYRLEQPLAHTAGPEEGVCERAAGFWEALRAHAGAYNQGRERRYERLDISLRGMRSGGDGLTEWAELTIAYRIPPALALPEVRTAVESLAHPEATVHYRGEEMPYQAAKNTRLVAALLSGIRAVGGRPAFSFKTGTSDMNVVGPVWNCPIAAYGPGDSSLDHTPEERIDLAEYELAIRVLVEALKAL